MTHSNYNRRFRNQKLQTARTPARKLVTFESGGEFYAIAIERVQRVLKDFSAHGGLSTGQSLVRYQDEVIVLVDFSKVLINWTTLEACQYLIVCRITASDKLGIPIPEMPKILEVTEAQISEIPQLYGRGNLPKAVEKLICTADGLEFFYLNLDLLANLNA